MAIKKSSEITDVNKLGMHDFYIQIANEDDQTVLISGDRGYAHYYRVELQFFDVEYIACALFFGDMGAFQFRQATEQETATIYEDFLEDQPQAVYCFEEDISRSSFRAKARKFFIVASNVEITVHYDPENVHHLSALENMKNE